MPLKQLKIALLLLALTLSACIDKNPLLGTWVIDFDAIETSDPGEQIAKGFAQALLGGIEITFTEEERFAKGLGLNNAQKVQYKKISSSVWAVSDNGGNTWDEVKIVDENRIVFPSGNKKFHLKRKPK